MNGDDPAERAPESGTFAHDKAVSAFENTGQFIEPAAFRRILPGCCCLDDTVIRKP